MKPDSKTLAGSRVVVWAFEKETDSIEAVFDHIDGEFFHVYMNPKDVGKKKYKTIGYQNCELIKQYTQMELFE